MQITGTNREARKKIWSVYTQILNRCPKSEIGGEGMGVLEFFSGFEHLNPLYPSTPLELELHMENFDFGFDNVSTPNRTL